ncbi:Protein argonaute [Aspergillus fumigatus]
MEDFEYTNKLEGGLRHLRIQNADEVAKYSVPVETVARPNHNQTGKEIEVLMNAYPITKFPTRNVYQYDVQIGNGVEKNAVIKKVWNCNARKAALKQIVFDGQKLAWSMNNYPTGLNVVVDLDMEQGRPAGKASNTFRLTVRPTKTVNLAVLNSWLTGRTSMSEAVLEALSKSTVWLSFSLFNSVTNSHRLP